MTQVVSAEKWLQQSDELFDAAAVLQAVAAVAHQLENKLAGSHPLILAVMNGGVVFAGHLLPLLKFPLEFDYVHASRYGRHQHGGALHWKSAPNEQVSGRTVVLVDDILDAGETLAAIRQRVLALGARDCYSAVLVEKQHGRPKPIQADFVGLEVPDRYVFGFGMDVQGVWRNLPTIRALKET